MGSQKRAPLAAFTAVTVACLVMLYFALRTQFAPSGARRHRRCADEGRQDRRAGSVSTEKPAKDTTTPGARQAFSLRRLRPSRHRLRMRRPRSATRDSLRTGTPTRPQVTGSTPAARCTTPARPRVTRSRTAARATGTPSLTAREAGQAVDRSPDHRERSAAHGPPTRRLATRATRPAATRSRSPATTAITATATATVTVTVTTR